MFHLELHVQVILCTAVISPKKIPIVTMKI